MELRDCLRMVRKAWPLIAVGTLLGLAVGVTVTLATADVYRASVQVFVATSTTANANDLAQGQTFAQDRVQSYVAIADSPAVTRTVVDRLHLALSPDELGDKISADAPADKVLINLHVTDHDPRTAVRLANAVGARFDEVVQDTEQTDANGKPVVKLTVIHPATVPSEPIAPSAMLDAGLGLVIGLALGIALAVLRDALDNTIASPQDLVPLGLPVLGLVPTDKRAAQAPIAFRTDPHGLRSEAYRQLRINLQFVKVDDVPRVIAVTSAVSGEGKTATAMNLAAALAEAGHRVVLIEADLRRPTIARSLGLVGEVGLTTVLIDQASLDDALQNAGHNLAVLTSGAVPPNPTELLTSAHAHHVIRAAAERADFTIIDTAPLLPVADGAEIAAVADATLVVHRAGKTTKDQAARSLAALANVGEQPVGVVLNMVSRNGGYQNGESYYYTYRPERDGHSAQRLAARPAQTVGAGSGADA